MVGRFTHIDLPDGVEAFVFGSALIDISAAADLDVLIVYDAQQISPSDIYDVVRLLTSKLNRESGIQVHPVVLSTEEEAAHRFRSSVQAIPLAQWLGTRQ
jgi:hypothetical protein